MSDSVTLKVPSGSSEMSDQTRFIDQVRKHWEKNKSLVLDFQDHPFVSSMTLGCIMFHFAKGADRLHFTGVGEVLQEQLKLIMGDALDLVL